MKNGLQDNDSPKHQSQTIKSYSEEELKALGASTSNFLRDMENIQSNQPSSAYDFINIAKSISTGNSLIPEDEKEKYASVEKTSEIEQTEEETEQATGILVKFDPTIQLPEIKEFLNNASPEEDPEYGGDTFLQQTKVEGILAPLVMVNDTVIPFNSISHLELSDNPVPRVTLEFKDRFDLVKTFDKPTKDNKLQVQIIPSFENAYKKINLTFWITKVDFDNNDVYIRGIYNIPKFNDIKLKAYGELSTYEFFEQIAKEYQLGFASNLENTEDKRWIYMPNTHVTDSLTNECEIGGNEQQILDWWIDWWNYVNLVDVLERNKTIDKDIKVWATPHKYIETETGPNPEPILCEAMLTNQEFYRDFQLYVSEYEEVFSSSPIADKMIETYKIGDMEEDNFIIRDGDVNNDLFIEYEYGGENFGEHKYLKQRYCREMWLSKIRNSMIKVSLRQPCLSLMKGHKVNFYWYTVNEFTKSTKDSDDVNSNIPLPEDSEIEELRGLDPDKQDDEMIIDKQISGQYYIVDSKIIYEYNGGEFKWQHILTLSRPEDQKEYFDWESIKTQTN